jgi:hypothetical protein
MANMQTISRLFATAPQPAPVKLPHCGNSQADVPAEPSMHELFARSLAQPLHRRFLTPRRSRNDAPAMMSPIGDTSIPAGRSFSDVAMRESVTQMRETLARRYSQRPRGAAGHQQWPMAIQI